MAKLRLGVPNPYDEEKPEGKSEAPPKAPKKPPPGAAPKKPTQRQLESELKGLFDMVAGGLYFADPVTAKWTEQKSPELARAWAVWAQKNSSVARFLEMLVSGGAAGNAIGVTAVWAVGCYLIYLSRQGELPPAWSMAGGLLGVPLNGGGPQGASESPQGPPEDTAGGPIDLG